MENITSSVSPLLLKLNSKHNTLITKFREEVGKEINVKEMSERGDYFKNEETSIGDYDLLTEEANKESMELLYN